MIYDNFKMENKRRDFVQRFWNKIQRRVKVLILLDVRKQNSDSKLMSYLGHNHTMISFKCVVLWKRVYSQHTCISHFYSQQIHFSGPWWNKYSWYLTWWTLPFTYCNNTQDHLNSYSSITLKHFTPVACQAWSHIITSHTKAQKYLCTYLWSQI